MSEQEKNEIIETQDGSHTLLSHQFGVSYHSKYGAVQESNHVFVNAGLKARMLLDDAPLAVLEYGFGTGLNALLTYQIAEEKKRPIYYEGMEAFPVTEAFIEQLNYPHQIGIDKDIFLKLHQSSWNKKHAFSPYFTFQKVKAFFADQDYNASFDVVYFDAFAPSAQGELWEQPLLEKAYRALRPNGHFVTYCAKGAVKRTLKAIGFKVEALPGPPGKREMTRCIKI